MSKHRLHLLVERLDEAQVEAAEQALSDLVEDNVSSEEPLSAATLAAIEAARARIRAGDFQTLEEYERERAR